MEKCCVFFEVRNEFIREQPGGVAEEAVSAGRNLICSKDQIRLRQMKKLRKRSRSDSVPSGNAWDNR
jgi:hypothetical protein